MRDKEVKSYACPQCPEGKRRLGQIRGLCQSCYKRACVRVRAGLASWEAMACVGMANRTPQEKGLRRNTIFDGTVGSFEYGQRKKAEPKSG